MWVLKRREDGRYVAENGKIHSYTRSLILAKKYLTKDEAIQDSCPGNESPIEISPEDILKWRK